MILPRRRVSELFSYYNTRPEIRDLFVEGPSDKRVLEIALGKDRPFGSKIWAISDLEVDVIEMDGEGGAREVVVAICNVAARENIASVIGLVDRDLQDVSLGGIESNIIVTNFTSLDYHLLEFSEIRDVIYAALGADISGEMNFAEGVARVLFSLRRIRMNSASRHKLPKLSKFSNIGAKKLEFRLEELLTEMDSRNSSGDYWSGKADEVTSATDQYWELAPEQATRFKDVEELVGEILRRRHQLALERVRFDWLGSLARARVSHGSELNGLLIPIAQKLNGI